MFAAKQAFVADVDGLGTQVLPYTYFNILAYDYRFRIYFSLILRTVFCKMQRRVIL